MKNKLTRILFLVFTFQIFITIDCFSLNSNEMPIIEKIDTNSIVLLSKSAGNHLNNGDYDKAITLYEESLQLIDSFLNINQNESKKFLLTHKGEINIHLSKAHLYEYNYDDFNKVIQKSFDISNELVSFELLSRALQVKGQYFEQTEKYDSALNTYLEAYRLDTITKNAMNIASNYINLGNIYTSLGDYSSAQTYFIKAIHFFESRDDKSTLSLLYNNLGLVYEYIENEDKALSYYQKAVDIDLKQNNKYGLSVNYCNIGNVYQTKKDFEKSVFYHRKALAIDIELKDTFGIAADYGNLANAYLEIENYQQALEYTIESERLFNTIGLKKELSITYSLFSEIYLNTHEYLKALEYAQKSFYLADEIKSIEDIKVAYQSFSKIYGAMKNYKKAYEYQTKYYEIKDSLVNLEKIKTINNLEVAYQTKKKSKEVLESKKELKETSFLLDKKNFQVIVLIVFSSFIAVSLILLIHVVFNKNKINKILASSRNDIQEKNEELSQQNAEISAQKEEIASQKILLENKNTFLTDSIEYAEKIQQAVLPPVEVVNSYFNENFIFYLPKNIVSGDFYWVADQNHLKYLAVADCTGHGVPGAFMSLLGITYLNEIMNSFIIKNASDCLNQLRNKVVTSLHQSGGIGENKDGLDLGLCIIDKEDQSISYSGAHIPLVIVNQKEFKVIKADPRPIGIYSKEKNYSFTEHSIDYETGDMLYMFTDGFIDQFGGELKKKYKKTRLFNLLKRIHYLSVEDQQQAIADEFERWKQDFDQIDDVLIMGVRL